MNATCKSSGPAFSLTLFSPARNFTVLRTGSNGSALMNVTCKSSGPTAPSTSFSQTFILLLLLSDSLFSDSNQMGLAAMVPKFRLPLLLLTEIKMGLRGWCQKITVSSVQVAAAVAGS